MKATLYPATSRHPRPPSLPPDSLLQRRLIAAAMALAILGVLALSIDLDVARWCKTGHVPKGIMRFLNFSEVCGHGIGVATILLVAVVLDRSLGGRQASPDPPRTDDTQTADTGIRVAGLISLPFNSDFVKIVAASFAGGIMANVVKATPLDRVRPRAADLSAAATALATFGDSVATTVASHSDINSFPSGHAATAAGLAAALSWKYPRGTWLFFMLAASAAAQRVVTSAHYPSDVFMGAALGLACAAVILGWKRFPAKSTQTCVQ